MKSIGILLGMVGLACGVILVLVGSLRWHTGLGWGLLVLHTGLLWLWVWMS